MPQTDMSAEFIEKLAEIAHSQWSGWMEYLFSKCTVTEDGMALIPKWAYERWSRQLLTKYKDLPEKEKASDRVEAQKYIDAFAQRDRDTLTKAAERVDTLSSDARMDLNTIERAKRKVLAPLAKGGANDRAPV